MRINAAVLGVSVVAVLSVCACDCTPAATNSGTDSGVDAGANTGQDAGPDAGPTCPHVILPSQVPLTYDGGTDGQPNWVDSPRLEWTTAPDDSLLYVTPQTGSFGFRVLDSSNADLNLSIRDLDGTFHATRGCPGAGQTLTLDGVYESNTWHLLDAGTEVLIWVSTPSWAATPTGTYQLEIRLE